MQVAVTKDGTTIPDTRNEAPLCPQQYGKDEQRNMSTKDQHSEHQHGTRRRPSTAEHGSHTTQPAAEETHSGEVAGQHREALVDANLIVYDTAEALAGAASAVRHSHGAQEPQPLSQEPPGMDEPASKTEPTSVARAEPQAEESTTAAFGQAQKEEARLNTASAEAAEIQNAAEFKSHSVEEDAVARAAADEDEAVGSQAQHSQQQDGLPPRPDSTEHAPHTTQPEAEEIGSGAQGGIAPSGQHREALVDANLIVSDTAEALAGAAAAVRHSHGAQEPQPLSQEPPSMDEPASKTEPASVARAEPQAEESSTAAFGQAQKEEARLNTASAEAAEIQNAAEFKNHSVEEDAVARAAADEDEAVGSQAQHSQQQDGLPPRPDSTEHAPHTTQPEAEEIGSGAQGGIAPCGQHREALVDANLIVSDAEALLGAAAAVRHSHGAQEPQPLSQEPPSMDEPASKTEPTSVARAEPQAEESSTAAFGQAQKEEARLNTASAEAAEIQNAAEFKSHSAEEDAVARAAADEDEAVGSQAQHSQQQDGLPPRPDSTEHASHTTQPEAEEIGSAAQGGIAPSGQHREALVDANLIVSDTAEALAGAAAAVRHSHGAQEPQPLSQEPPGMDEPALNTEPASVARAEPQAEESSTAAFGQAQKEEARLNTASAEAAEIQNAAEFKSHSAEEDAVARAAADEDEAVGSQAQHSQQQDGLPPRPDSTEHASHTTQPEAEEIGSAAQGGIAPSGQHREALVDANLIVSDTAEALAGVAAAVRHSHGAQEPQPLSQEPPGMDEPALNTEPASVARAEPQAEESGTAAISQAQKEESCLNTTGAQSQGTLHQKPFDAEGVTQRKGGGQDGTVSSQDHGNQQEDSMRPKPGPTWAKREEIPCKEQAGIAMLAQDGEVRVSAFLKDGLMSANASIKDAGLTD